MAGALVIAMPTMSLADAADGAAEPDGADSAIQEVVVLGTNRTDVSVLDSPSPVNIYSAKDIEESGAENLVAFLQRSVPSINMPLGAANTFASGRYAQSAALRGMAPDQTLVLVNGKRRVPSAMVINRTVWGRGSQPTDLNGIPLPAVERIEVLRDGAASQYGSDAIAGVINIVLRSHDSGADLKYQVGNYSASGKPFGAPKPSQSLQGIYGAALPGIRSFVNVSVDGNKLHHPREGHPDAKLWYFPGDPREAGVDHTRSIAHFPADQEKISGLVNSEIGLTDLWRLYAAADYAHIKRFSLAGYTYPSDDKNLRDFYPNGYADVNRIVVATASASAGTRYDGGDLGRFDFGVSYGRYDQANNSTKGVNPSLGLDSPIGFKIDGYVSQLASADLQWVRDIPLRSLPAPLTVSAGLSYREERYRIEEGDEASWFYGGSPILDGPNAGKPAPYGAGLPPQDAGTYSRHVAGTFFGIEGRPFEPLQLGLSGRFEDYSDFGTTATGKLTARYEISPSLALRSSFGNGYRAPSLGQAGASSSSFVPILGLNAVSTSVQTRLLPVDDPIARALGSRDLRPEKSRNIAAGLVLQPFEGASVTLDLYQIKVRDKIVLSENLSGAFVRSVLTAAGYPQVQVASFYTNALDTRTRGADLFGHYRVPALRSGRLDLTLGYAFTETEVIGVAPNPPQLAGSGVIIVGRQAIGLIEDAAPKGKLVVGATYDIGKWNIDAAVKRYGEYKEYHPNNPAFDQRYSAQWITDLSVGFRLTNSFRLTVGALNLFDTHPDRQRPELRVLGTSKYSDLAPEGMDGSFFYGRAAYQF